MFLVLLFIAAPWTHSTPTKNQVKYSSIISDPSSLLVTNSEGFYPIHFAVQKRKIAFILALKENDLLTDQLELRTEENGATPLQLSIAGGHIDLMKILVEAGADVNSVDKFGRSALIIAAYRGTPEQVEYLLLNGADVHRITYYSMKNPTEYALAFNKLRNLKLLREYSTETLPLASTFHERFLVTARKLSKLPVDAIHELLGHFLRDDESSSSIWSKSYHDYNLCACQTSACVLFDASAGVTMPKELTSMEIFEATDTNIYFLEYLLEEETEKCGDVHFFILLVDESGPFPSLRPSVLLESYACDNIEYHLDTFLHGPDNKTFASNHKLKESLNTCISNVGLGQVKPLAYFQNHFYQLQERHDPDKRRNSFKTLFGCELTEGTDDEAVLTGKLKLVRSGLVDIERFELVASSCSREDFQKHRDHLIQAVTDNVVSDADKQLILKRPELLEIIDDSGDSLVHIAVYCNNIEFLEWLGAVSLGKAAVGIKNSEGLNAFSYAVSRPLSLAPGMMDALITLGFDINQREQKQRTCLMLCSRKGDVSCVRILLAHGARVDLVDKYRSTALMYSFPECHTDVTMLLLEAKATPNGVSQSRKTPLNIAIENGCADAIRLLLKHGADINRGDHLGVTPLVAAVNKRDTRILSIVLEGNPDVSQRDPLTGFTAIDFAKTEEIRKLLEARNEWSFRRMLSPLFG